MNHFCKHTFAAWQRSGHVFAQWARYRHNQPDDGLRSHLHNAESGDKAPVDGSDRRRGYLPGVRDPLAAWSAVEGVLGALNVYPQELSRVRAELKAAASGDGFLQKPGDLDFKLRDKVIRAVNRNWPM